MTFEKSATNILGMLPDDLKDYRDSFSLFTPEEAGVILGVTLFGVVAYDALGRLIMWMFG